MAENFFLDNSDLVRAFGQLDLTERIDALEAGYQYHDTYPEAPRNYADAMDTYRLMLTVIGDISANRIEPRADEAALEGAHLEDGHVVYPAAMRDSLALLKQAGLMGALLPREYGGLNLPETIYSMMIEVVSRAEAGLMTVFGLQEIAATVEESGTDEIKADVLPRFARGEVTGAMALTEPDAGSDLGSVQTRATLDEDDGTWSLRGVKRFITNGNASILVVLARSEAESTDARGLSLFLVETDETVAVRRLENKMGLRASPTCEIEFRDTPAKLLGKRRFGLIRHAMGMMSGARLAVGAQALGIAEAACREAENYASRRTQFGKAVGEIPAVYRMLLAMRCEVEATRALVYEAAWWVDMKLALEEKKERGELAKEERPRLKRADRMASVLTPILKYHGSEMSSRVCHQAIQVHGGAGYMREFNVERHYRDARVTSIYEGTSQMQVVAAIGPLMGRTLDLWLEERAALDYGDGLADLRSSVEKATGWLDAGITHLAEQDREIVDYYAVDLVELAAHVVTCWLVLRDAAHDERKARVASVYISASMPKMRCWSDAITASDRSPIDEHAAIFEGA